MRLTRPLRRLGTAAALHRRAAGGVDPCVSDLRQPSRRECRYPGAALSFVERARHCLRHPPLRGQDPAAWRPPRGGRTVAADPVPTWCGLVADTRASRGVEIVDGATVCVAVVGSRTEAALLAGILRSHGLKAAVSADDAGGQYPQMQIDGVRVLVAPSDEASARRLLAATDDLAEPDGGS